MGGDVEGSTPDHERETLTSRVLEAADREQVPLRTIVVSVGVVVATGILLVLAWWLRLELILVCVATFLAVLLSRPVDFLERHGFRRSLATTFVFVAFLLAFLGLAFLFGTPLVSHIQSFTKQLPGLVKKAEAGKGWLGHLINRFHLHHWVAKNLAPKLKQFAGKLAKPALSFGTAALSTLVALVTTAFLTYFLLLDLPNIWRGILGVLPARHADRIGRVAHEAATKSTGYVLGNLSTSVIAGIVVLITLLIFGVPFALLLALWVALVDLLPIVGALVAGVPTVAIALFHSPTAGIVTLIVFLTYQQVENHVLNPIIMSRTVKMSKLLVLLAVVFFAALGGKVAGAFGTFIGALVGIPLGSAIQVVVRELRQPSPLDPTPDS